MVSIIAILRLDRVQKMQEITTSLAKDDPAVEKTARITLQEWGINYGTINGDHRRGRAMRVTNQCANKTICIYTRMYLMGETGRL